MNVQARVLRMVETPVGAEMVLDGRRFINFGGSSYLGLSGIPEILEAGCAALRECGSGYQFHRHYDIATRGHLEAEAQAADFFAMPAAVYLASGYHFGLVGVAALAQKYTRLFCDEMAHHTLHAGAAASGLPTHSFRHLDVEDFEVNLKRHCRAKDRALIITDGMYATYGDIAPLDQFAAVMAGYEGRLLVDESHSFGVLGNTGRGASEHYNLPSSSVLFGGSTGKAFGVVGGLIPASVEEVAACRATPAGRGALSGLPAAGAMCARSLQYVRQHPELLERLRANTMYMKRGLRKLGLDVGETVAPVATFVTKPGDSLDVLQQQLFSEGIHVVVSHYIGAGSGGVIRCGIFADHTLEHMDRLFDALRRLL